MGRPIPATGITRIEKGQRRVDAGDLCALAIALDVSPLALLLPWEENPEAHVEVTDLGTVTARMAWQWGLGIQPMMTSTTDPEAEVQRFRLDSLPPFARFGSADVAVRKLAALEKMVKRLAMHKLTDTPDPEAIPTILNEDLLPMEDALALAKLSTTAAAQRVRQAEIERMGSRDTTEEAEG